MKTTCTQCARISGTPAPTGPAWWRARQNRGGQLEQEIQKTRELSAHIGRHGSGGEDAEIGGGVYLFASQVRALLDRVHLRYVSLKEDFARVAPNSPSRAAFDREFAAWDRFRREVYGDRLAWGTSVDQAEAYDRELDAWRARFVAETGENPTTPTTSETATPPSSFPSFSTVALPIAVVGGVALFAWSHIK